MLNVLFICHGNICRSPMAEFLFKDLVAKKDLQCSLIEDRQLTNDHLADAFIQSDLQ